MNDHARVHLTSLGLKTVFRWSKLWLDIKKIEDVLMLDVGCGEGGPAALISRQNKFKIVGLDIFKPSLDKAKKLNTYSGLVLGNATHLPFKDNSIDVVAGIAVLEHLDKADGHKLLDELERVAKRMMIISSPIGKWEQEALDGNPFQEHKYIWSLTELKEKGFQNIRGIGLKGMSGNTWGALLRSPIGLLFGVLAFIGTLFSYHIPEIASGVIACKTVALPHPEHLQ